MSSNNKRKRARYCVAPECKNYESAFKNNSLDTGNPLEPITYHSFPTAKRLRNKWFSFVGYKKKVTGQTWRTWTLCSEHFENTAFETLKNLKSGDIKLKNGAIPTKKSNLSILLPTTIEHNSQNTTCSSITEKKSPLIYEQNGSYSTDISSNSNSIEIEEKILNNSNIKDEIELGNEKIFTESEDDFHSKCGEIFITNKGLFVFFCTMCGENIECSQYFVEHIYKHVQKMQNDSDEDTKQNILTTENLVKIPKEMQQCEIVENEIGNFETISFLEDVVDNRKSIEKCSEDLENKNKIINNEDFIDLTEDENTEECDEKILVKNENDILEEISSTINPENTEILNCINSQYLKQNNSNNDHEISNLNEHVPSLKNLNTISDNFSDNEENMDDEDDDWNPNNQKRFKCKYCSKILKSQFSWTVHLRSHTGERPFKCNVCSTRFKSQGILYNHEKLHTGVKPFQCQYCGGLFYNQTNLKTHEKRHESQPNQYKCAYCQYKFLRLKKKMLHQRTHNIEIKQDPDVVISNDNKFKCDFCGKLLASQYTLIHHRRIHTGEKPFRCKFCPTAFRSNIYKSLHELSHTGERPFVCSHCDKSFVRKSSRDNHERIHSSDRPYKCEICNKGFRQPSAKYSHYKTHNRSQNQGIQNRKKKLYNCEFCNKNLASQHTLVAHRRIHTGEKPFSCDQCPAIFRSKQLLMYHHLIHTGEQPYRCKYCQKSFRLPSNLSAHIKTHSDERPFQCSYCDKCFRQKQAKTGHERTHIPGFKDVKNLIDIKQKLIKCDLCDKICQNKYILSNHMKTHTGERPFKCSFCPSAFKSSSHKLLHERIHSGYKPHNCDECSKAFTTKGQLTTHRRAHERKKNKKILHKCNHCDKEFRFNSNLILHQSCHKTNEL